MTEKKNAPSLKRIRELVGVMAEYRLEIMEVDGMKFVKTRYEMKPPAQPEKPKPPPRVSEDMTRPPKDVDNEAAQGLFALTHLMNNGHN